MIASLIVRASVALLTMLLVAAGTPAAAVGTTGPQPTGKVSSPTQYVGVFTGSFVNGMPLYRLPSVSVIAPRRVELAKMQREEQQTHVNHVRAKAVVRRPA